MLLSCLPGVASCLLRQLLAAAARLGHWLQLNLSNKHSNCYSSGNFRSYSRLFRPQPRWRALQRWRAVPASTRMGIIRHNSAPINIKMHTFTSGSCVEVFKQPSSSRNSTRQCRPTALGGTGSTMKSFQSPQVVKSASTSHTASGDAGMASWVLMAQTVEYCAMAAALLARFAPDWKQRLGELQPLHIFYWCWVELAHSRPAVR